MAHFAKLDSNNIVEQVIVVNNDDVTDSSGVEVESLGVAFCQKLFGDDTNWKKTSYNRKIRGNYAGIGYTYMTGVATLGVGSTDIFIAQQPYASWTVGVGTAEWYPPANPGPAPALTTSEVNAGKYYVWNESNYQSNPATAWVLTTP
tara:strand:+ start:110 stop:550 length:441 start_codon:yes stop_codon:yes gene_type:complete